MIVNEQILNQYRLKIEKQDFFEFSEHSVLSNLYWGIDGVEATIQSKTPEERTSRVKSAEQMLQIPALLDEQGVTAGIANRYLVCCSYFYLSVIRLLQKDQLQVALHFLQAVLVSPGHVRTEFAPELCESLFSSFSMSSWQESDGRRSLRSMSSKEYSNGEEGEAMMQMARRYKDWLIYYQVMLYGEQPRWHLESRDKSSLPDDNKTRYSRDGTFTSTEQTNSTENKHGFQTNHKYEKVHPLDPDDSITNKMTCRPKASITYSKFQNDGKALGNMDQIPKIQVNRGKHIRSKSIKFLKDMLTELQSDIPTFVASPYEDSTEYYSGENIDDTGRSATIYAGDPQAKNSDQFPSLSWKLKTSWQILDTERTETSLQQALQHPTQIETDGVNISNLNSSILKIRDRDKKSHTNWNFHVEDAKTWDTLEPHEFQPFDHTTSASMQHRMLFWTDSQRTTAKKIWNSQGKKNINAVSANHRKDSKSEVSETLEKAISKLSFPEGYGKFGEDYAVKVTTIYKMLNNKQGLIDALANDVVLDQLLTAISTSKEEEVIRASVFILTTIVSANRSALEDIKKKGLQLRDLASALKRNVHEAAILIYLINPSPTEIKTLELLPILVEVVCTSQSSKATASLQLTPPKASLMMIEVLVTAFDYATNNLHLSAINSPRVLCALLDVARNNNLEEIISLATILVKCMQFDGQCRKYIEEFTPIAPFIDLLQSNKKQAKFIALEYFHEILRMPRSSAISLLQRIRNEGSSINIMQVLAICVQQMQNEYQLLAANLLLQLDTLENSLGKSVFREHAVQILLKSVTSEESPNTQLLSSFILSNLGGTYSWTGEPYTVAWLVKKAGLTSLYHRNMIRNVDWMDPSLQDVEADIWCSKVARNIINIGNPVFHALKKGLKSKTKRVSRDCLTAIALLGCEISKSPNSLRYSACEILLGEIEQYLHPGLELEERLLACFCIYNYASGKGMQKLIHFSEGVRESLRRFSNITWMAEELHRVTQFFLPNKSRISCVHTQIIEAGHNRSGAVTALIYYKGLLYSGYSDGSIKVWDIKKQASTLIWDIKGHKKAVKCFTLFEPGENLLSGSADKTIGVWQIMEGKMECVEVVEIKEAIEEMDTYGQMVFVITKRRGMKVFDASRILKDISRRKNVKCMSVVQGKVYIGRMDSSIQELAITKNREQEIKAPTKSWRMQSRPINSIVVYKDWLYCASSVVEGSNIKDWRRHIEPQMSLVAEKGTNILAIGVVEDFIYLNCSSSPSIIQIWLRGTPQKVGRLSAGSKITSLLTANDIVLCGTETGLIKGWIPL